ncbi:MAG: AEC family transporter [Clostridia bacterium]|nr:AEC family transporter [Clostridia bacterium]
MSDFPYILNAILPLYLMVGAGIILRYALGTGAAEARIVNRVCFYVFLPCMLFKNAYEADFAGIGSPWLYVWSVAGFVLTGIFGILYAKKTVPDLAKAAAFAHSAIRKNTSLLGIPLALRYLGEDKALPAILMTTVLLPCMNIYGIVELSYFMNAGKSKKKALLGVAKGFATNPLIIALVLGFAANFLKVPVPDFLFSTVKGLAQAASPCAMVAIGMGFTFAGLRRNGKLVFQATFINIVLQPLFIVGIGVLLGFRGMDLTVLFLAWVVPCAANSAVISQSMGADGELSGEIVMTTTAFSMITIILGLMLMKSTGLM